MNTALLSGYMVALLAIVLSIVALILGLVLIGTPGPQGSPGPKGFDGGQTPANYTVTLLTPAAPDAGSSYNAKYYLVQGGALKIALTARNCSAGDTFFLANPLSVPVTVSPQAFSFPTNDFTLQPGSFARCGVSGLTDGTLSLLCMAQTYTPASSLASQ